MTKLKHVNELAALRRLALEDVLQASEADLREQAQEEGLDFNELAEKIRSCMRESAASVLREQLVKNRAPASLPEPGHRGPAGTGSYFDAYTADQLRAYGDARAAEAAAEFKRLRAVAQQADAALRALDEALK